jgi:hypothetical protein
LRPVDRPRERRPGGGVLSIGSPDAITSISYGKLPVMEHAPSISCSLRRPWRSGLGRVTPRCPRHSISGAAPNLLRSFFPTKNG